MPFTKQTHCKNGHELTPENVYVATHVIDGHQYRQCRICHNADAKARYYALTPEQRAVRRKSFPSNAKKAAYTRKHRLRERYGMSESEYHEMLIAQDGLCMICTTEGATHVDHDHETGKARGILCGSCNRALGLFKDDADALDAAALYVRRWFTWQAF